MWPADLVTFTEEIRNGQLHFLCSVRVKKSFKIQIWYIIMWTKWQTFLKSSSNIFGKLLPNIVKYRYLSPSGNRALQKSQRLHRCPRFFWYASLHSSLFTSSLSIQNSDKFSPVKFITIFLPLVLFFMLVCIIASTKKFWRMRGASFHQALMGNCPTCSHTSQPYAPSEWVMVSLFKVGCQFE